MIALESRPRVGLVEPHEGLRADLARALESMGCEVTAHRSVASARKLLDPARVQALVIDVEASGAAEWLRDHDAPHCPRLVMGSGPARVLESAEACERAEWLGKPFSIRLLERRLIDLLDSDRSTTPGDAILETEDPVFRECLDRARRWARGAAAINLEGEFGTGRRALARAIHEWSPRRAHPFVVLEPASFAAGGSAETVETVVRSLEKAREGTLLIVDPVGLSEAARAALVRALRSDPERSTPRWITSSATALAEATAEGRIEAELQYRLEGLRLRLPPLRERLADQEALCRGTARRVARELGRPTPMLDPRWLDALRAEGFPGNRVGLESRLRRTIIGGELAGSTGDGSFPRTAHTVDGRCEDASLDLKTVERDTIVRALAYWQGNRTRASESLGISVRTLRNKIRDYGLR